LLVGAAAVARDRLETDHRGSDLPCGCRHGDRPSVTTQDFINFWGKIFAFVMLEMIEFSQGFKTFESIWKLY
jgi:hypothetical protein